jgi:hypothetical protein
LHFDTLQKKIPDCPLLSYPGPLQNEIVISLIEKGIYLYSLSLSWRCALFGPKGCSRSDGIPIPSLSLKGPCSFLHFVVEICQATLNKSNLDYWKAE